MSKAFTLTELLITVAIISILALLAVPNLQEASTRAKVARSRNDLRVVAGALEVYHVDSNHYPGSFMLSGLTTPVAYLTAVPDDPFYPRVPRLGARAYVRQQPTYYWLHPELNIGHSISKLLYSMAGDYVLFSRGPDMLAFNGVYGKMINGVEHESNSAMFRDYDPTNGTISFGNLIRTAKNPVMIGTHPTLYIDVWEGAQSDSDVK